MTKPAKNYPRNCWWVGATSAEVGRKPVGRWLLDQPVMFYRKTDGSPVALEDRCPHRWAPLSAGRIVEDTVMCPYHGARFDDAGRCVLVPTQGNVLPQVKVHSYPLCERNGFCWIWMGDPALADPATVPDLSFVDGAGWDSIQGYMPVAANYFLIQENVLDLTHFGFLHADTLEQEGWDQGVSEVKTHEGQVTYRKQIDREPLAPFISLPLGLEPGALGYRVDWGTFVQPAAHIAGIDYGLDAPVVDEASAPYHFRISHLTTPSAMGQTHYWWVLGLNLGQPAQHLGKIRDIINPTFDQDKELLERIQAIIDRDPPEAEPLEVSFVADRPGLLARRTLRKMLDAEREAA